MRELNATELGFVSGAGEECSGNNLSMGLKACTQIQPGNRPPGRFEAQAERAGLESHGQIVPRGRTAGSHQTQ